MEFNLEIFDIEAAFKKGKDRGDPKRRPHSKFKGLDFEDVDKIMEDMKKKYG